jgi:hypothetical protein
MGTAEASVPYANCSMQILNMDAVVQVQKCMARSCFVKEAGWKISWLSKILAYLVLSMKLASSAFKMWGVLEARNADFHH